MKAELLRSLFLTEAIHGLERFNQLHLDPDLWHRFRLDDDYARGVITMMTLHNQRFPGKRFSITMDRSQSRADLLGTLRSCRFDFDASIEQINALQPQTVYPHAGQFLLVRGIHDEEMTLFLVDPKRSLTEGEARWELWHRGLEPIQTEEALHFGLVIHSDRINEDAVALDSCALLPDRGFLRFSAAHFERETSRYFYLEKPSPTFKGAPSFLGKHLPWECRKFQRKYFRLIMEGADEKDNWSFREFCETHQPCEKCKPFVYPIG